MWLRNTTAVLTVAAMDTDSPAQTVTYSITGGVDQAKFSINATTGELTFQAAPDYETPTDADANNVYEVQVTADDGNGGTTAQSISVTVTPANDNSPVVTSANTANVTENTTAVLTVTATDADAPAQTVTYSITGGADSGKFVINATTGRIDVPGSSGLRESCGCRRRQRLRSANHGRRRETAERHRSRSSVVLANINEPPTDLSLSGNSVDERSANGTFVGTAATLDPDAGEAFVYVLVDDAGRTFRD